MTTEGRMIMNTENITYIYQNCTLPVLEALADINPHDLYILAKMGVTLYIWSLATDVELTFDKEENTVKIAEV